MGDGRLISSTQISAGVEKSDALIRQRGQEFAADDLGIESRALVDVAYRNAEMRDTLDLGSEGVRRVTSCCACCSRGERLGT